MEIISSLIDGSYMPHGHCYLWKPEILWTNVLSDFFIAASYFSIPVTLYYIKKKRQDWQYTNIYILFSLFIFMCGITHLMAIVTVWNGVYGIQGIAKAVTAVVSFSTAISLLNLSPKILKIPSVAEIDEANRELVFEKIANSQLKAEQESQRLLSITLNAAPIGLLALDRNGVIQIANREVTQILGYQSGSLVGQPARTLLVENKNDSILSSANIQQLIDSFGVEFSYVHPSIVDGQVMDGTQLPLEIRMHGEFFGGEHIIFVSLADQSFKQKVEKENAHLSAIIESCDEAIIGKDLAGVITHWNHAAEVLYGYNKSEMVGTPILKLVPEELQNEVNGFLGKLRQGQKVDHLDTVRLKKDGSKIDVMLTISPIRDTNNNIIGASTIARDITERKRAQQLLEDKNRALEASNKELEHFAFIASHDLKEPLRKILSFGRIIKEEVEDKLSEQSKEFLGYMLSAAERMQSLLESLLSYSRITSRANPFEAVDLNKILQDVVNDLQLTIDECDAIVEYKDMPTVLADTAQMHQLFQNLISNSLKYRQKDIPPHINISCIPSSTYAVVISVLDNGIGFAQEHAEQIFDMFKRLHGRSQYEGTGVGLAICRKIIEHHEGIIIARSSLGKGAEFRLCFPN